MGSAAVGSTSISTLTRTRRARDRRGDLHLRRVLVAQDRRAGGDHVAFLNGESGFQADVVIAKDGHSPDRGSIFNPAFGRTQNRDIQTFS